MGNPNLLKIFLFIFLIWICLYYNNENGINKSLNKVESTNGLSNRQFYRILEETECKKKKHSKKVKESNKKSDNGKNIIKLTIDISHDKLIATTLIFGSLLMLLNVGFTMFMFLNKFRNELP
ncbi:Plasmodium exported protein, unknown function [Plasmodium berghei]|uniref:Uncharacterized protein n=2 Tax=Plasmodium berghei TaxID=5821 RepID=A0A509AI03_PLABA|nr:Plasmodium exported protein, unknown function [Plasmodium berghei ANKA]SCM21671.1 Plasmodium exported protein, unknown function [Plasmodium berghei]SCN24869.1 Plasmodium exported protein, unknown function [Plasmodium berghei]SCO61373.1 Plasmodium exported protein, unknown function [Plasmodium berghei]VUC55525.1 Plasmodium exported protein, unknown function [Plasmodium berghei ANKA]|eukprot:XP_034421338.1 Plasmodium exported protein, unknown function [Plasmodium berghei ANKA]